MGVRLKCKQNITNSLYKSKKCDNDVCRYLNLKCEFEQNVVVRGLYK